MLNANIMVKDLKASVVVFLVALPLCLGISLASGAPLIAGILSGIIGGIIIGILGPSQTSVSGPAAGLTVIVLSAIQNLGNFYSFTLAVVIAGVMQILFGLIKAGNAGSYFPNSVIKAMLAAIGLILILKQIPHFVGFDKNFMGDEAFLQKDGLNTFSEITAAFESINMGALGIAVLSLFSMIVWDRQAKKGNKFLQLFPSSLFVVLLGIFINLLFQKFNLFNLTADHFVSLPIESGFHSFFSQLHFPNWNTFTNPMIYKIAFTLALVGSLETLLSIEAVDKLDPHKRITNKNTELIAQGVGNTLSGLVGGLPITAVIVRSSANIAAGGVSKMSTIFHGIWMFLAVVFIPSYLELIPLASLASILMLVGYKLCPPSLFKELKNSGKEQFIPFIVTILAILFTDLLIGIFIGISVGLIFIIRSSSKKSIVIVNEDSNYLIRFMKDVSFLQKPNIKKILNDIPGGSSVVIDGSNHLHVDNDIVSIIQEFMEVCQERSIKCEIIKSTFAMNDFFKE